MSNSLANSNKLQKPSSFKKTLLTNVRTNKRTNRETWSLFKLLITAKNDTDALELITMDIDRISDDAIEIC